MATNKNFEVKNGLSVGGTERISSAGAFSGSLASGVTATTQSAADNSTKIATTAYTDAAITAVIGGAPGTLDTLNELAAAIADDENYSTTLTTALALKAPLASPTFTGTLTLPGGTSGTRTIKDSYTSGSIANQGFLRSSGGNYWGYGAYQDGSTNWKSAVSVALERSVFAIDEDQAYWSHAPSQTVSIGSDLTTQPTKKVVFDLENGRVGIGTDAPTHGLTVSDLSGGDDANMRRITIKSETHGVNSGFRFDSESANGTARGGGYYFQPGDTDATTYLGLSATDAGYQMAIARNGNVGIGTTAPYSKLNVQGTSPSTYTGNGPGATIRASQSTDGNWIASDVDGKFAYFGVDGNDAKWAAYNYATSTEMGMVLGQNRVRIDNTGRVGINRTPTITNSKLEVGGADNVPLINVEASGATAGVGIGSSRMKFYYGTAEKASIDINGNLRTARQIIQENSDGTPRFINIPFSSAGSGFTFNWDDLANHSAVGDQSAETNAFMFEVNVTSYLFRRVKALIIVDTNATNSIAVHTIHSSTLTCSASIPTGSEQITITIGGLWGNSVNYMGRITTF